MKRRSGPIFTVTGASGLLLGLLLSLVACPRPIDNPADPDPPIATDPSKGDTVEPNRPAPGDAGPAGPTRPINPVPDDPATDPATEGREHPAVEPVAPPPMDPKNAPLRV